MRKFNLLGLRFGRLVVVAEAPNKGRNVQWRCLCDCGNSAVILATYLRYGDTKSCGCLKLALLIERSVTHGQSGTLIFRTWQNIISRCGNPNNPCYADYR